MRRILSILCLALLAGQAGAQTNFATLTSDGVWTWFNDPRAIFHHGVLYFGYVRSSDGRSALSTFNLQSGMTANLWASTLTETDDHDVAGLQVKQDDTLLAIWARHGGDQFFSYRLSSSTNPVSPADWGAEQTIANSGAGLTYANPCQLINESGKIYDFCRDLNYNPTVFTSTDGGATWSTPQLMIKTGTGSTRPYVKYCSDYSRRIDFLYTDAHPDNYTCSLYQMYYQGGAFYKTDGTFITNFANLPILHDSGQRGSVVYQYNAAASSDPNQWIATARAWCWDMAYQTNGYPACVFQVKVDAVTGTSWSDARVYYYYARWTGTNWQKRFIAQAGRPLYNGQPDYGGGIALDPQDVNTIYIATDAASPFDLTTTTNVPLGGHYEIWKGVTSDGGLTFAWQAVTTNSTVDNLRPYVPRRFGGEPCVLWFRGTYTSYTSFSTAIVGMFTTQVPTPGVVTSPPLVLVLPRLKKANNANDLISTTSWLGGVAPGAGDIALWDSTVTAANTVALGDNLSWSGICVTNPGGAVAITTGNTLTLGASGIDMSGATANLAVSSGLTLGSGDQVWNVATGRTLTLNTGTFTRTAGATLNIQGSGTVLSSIAGFNATDASTPSPGIIGPWATVGSGTSTRYATTNSGNIAPYTGYSGVFNWSTTIPNFTNVEISATSAAIGIDRMCNTIRWSGGTATQNYGSGSSANRLYLRGILNAGTGPLTFVKASGTPTFVVGTNGAGGGRELVLNAAAAGINVGVPIADSAAGASPVIVTGTGTNTVTMSGANAYTGGTTVNTGNLTLSGSGTLGAAGGALTVNGGTLDLGTKSPTVGAVTINGGTIQNGTLTGASYVATTASGASVSAVLAGASAALTKNGGGTVALWGNNTYGGGTTVSGGTLLVNNTAGSGTGSGTVTVAGGGTLGGNGIISGPVTVQAGGTLSPGADALGTLTVNNAVTLEGGTRMGINRTNTPNSDTLAATAITYGGTLSVTNLGGTLLAGDSFQLFSASARTGSFANTNLPPLGAGLGWNFNAASGLLSVVQTVATNPTNISYTFGGASLTLSWPADYLGWVLQAQTNSLTAGISNNWHDVPGSGSSTQAVITIDPHDPTVFFRLRYP